MDRLEGRVRRAVESLLENEGLTSDLDDAAAKELLDWGAGRARQIAESTAGLEDEQAEEAMYPQMRALRRLMRSLNKLVGGWDDMGVESATQLIDDIFEQAAELYGGRLAPSRDDLRQALTASSSQERVKRVLDLVAPPGETGEV